ncbi:hypothetical protein Ahy_A09g041514 [Arachis hypogaea]|uniref:PB1-like domain-containing protein n=1 Tax=Arachis hypogaea TaxID=3818 RepID=A0A445BCY6_ARAHY|nr:hypothetical protein Ahy_A09g041514 [Arachis hypogaea]
MTPLQPPIFKLPKIQVDVENKVSWVKVSATVGELYSSIGTKTKIFAVTADVCIIVGVGGQFSGSDYGFLIRKYGLSIKNIIDAHIIDVIGRFFDREVMDEDLFWAIKGGGGASFGIKLIPIPSTVTPFRILKKVKQNATKLVHKRQSMGDLITIVYHYGGNFVTKNDGSVVYEKDNTDELTGLDEDRLDSGLRALSHDKKLLEMYYFTKMNQGRVYLYFEYRVFQLHNDEVSELIEFISIALEEDKDTSITTPNPIGSPNDVSATKSNEEPAIQAQLEALVQAQRDPPAQTKISCAHRKVDDIACALATAAATVVAKSKFQDAGNTNAPNDAAATVGIQTVDVPPPPPPLTRLDKLPHKGRATLGV